MTLQSLSVQTNTPGGEKKNAVKSLIIDTSNPIELQCFSSCLAVVFAQSIEARC